AELALFVDRGDHGGAAVFELAQVAQAFFQRAQMSVVQAAGHFLAVAGDEGHGGAVVEELDGGDDLARRDAEFIGDAVFGRREDGGRGGVAEREGRDSTTAGARRATHGPGWGPT